jgi:two-component system response regulator PilR (NtrC family)
MANPLKILAVDNEPSVTLSLRYVFTSPRYDLTTAENGHAALARLSADEMYDVIMVDQKMPDLTGVELVKEIKERGAKSAIIVLSAHLSEEIRVAYERLDVRVIFTKPFDIAQLRSAVDAQVG